VWGGIAVTTDIKCAKCKVPIQGLGKPDPKSIGVCPVCGASDTQENIMREAGEYVHQQTTENLGNPFRDLARRHKSFKFTEAPRQKRAFRFIVDI
jgi:hypothetical protein